MASNRSVCFSCREPVHAPSCVGCGALQPPPPTPDPFELFGLPHRFHVDVSDVDAKYRTIARSTHPDRFTTRPAVERRMSLQWTAALNEAKRVLKDDRLRARWLATGRATAAEDARRQMDPAFLAQMFEWREAEEESPGSTHAEAAAARDALLAEIDAAFTAWEAGTGTLDHVEDRLLRLNYVEGLLRPAPEA